MQQKFDEFPIIKGAKVRYEGSVCEIDSFLSLDQLLLKSVESGRVFSAKIANIKPLNNVEFKSSGIKTDLSYLDCSIDWEGAKKREMIIAELAMKGCPRKKAKEAARELNISDRRVYKLVDKYRRSGFKLTSLIPLTSQGGKGKGRITTTIEQIIAATINELYLSKQKHKASYVIQEIKRRCHVAGLKPPSKNTIRSRIERLSEYEKKKKREGENAAKQFTPVYGSFPEPEYPLAVFQIDHTKVDLIVVDELYRQPIGRPYLTIAIDAFSRCIAGFCLTLEAPSATSVGLCLTHAVFEKDYWLISKNIKTSWPIWGKPDGIYVDNAQEFHSEALQRGCDLHGIKIEFRPKGQPHFGGIVERVIGTMM